MGQDLREVALPQDFSVSTPRDISSNVLESPGRQRSGTDLAKAYLSKTVPSYTDLTGADLTGANLRLANLSQAKLAHADATNAYYTPYFEPILLFMLQESKGFPSFALKAVKKSDSCSFENFSRTLVCATWGGKPRTDRASQEHRRNWQFFRTKNHQELERQNSTH
jgi:hypothetical protein